jgi:hypothetical protein
MVNLLGSIVENAASVQREHVKRTLSALHISWREFDRNLSGFRATRFAKPGHREGSSAVSTRVEETLRKIFPTRVPQRGHALDSAKASERHPTRLTKFKSGASRALLLRRQSDGACRNGSATPIACLTPYL